MKKKKKKQLQKRLRAFAPRAEYIRTDADYMANKLNTIALKARLVIGSFPSLPIAEQVRQLYEYALENAKGHTVAEQISRNILGIEPYGNASNQPTFNPFPVPQCLAELT
jgi:hypothetical protein